MAGTVTQAIEHVSTQSRGTGKGGFKIVTFTCVGDSSDGSIPDTATTQLITNQIVGCYLLKVQIIPGATGPQTDSDVYIKDANGIDLLDGNGVDKLDTTGNDEAYAQIDGQAALQPIVGALTLDVNQAATAVNSATYQIICIFVSSR